MRKKILMIIALLCAIVQETWADTWDGSTTTRPQVSYQQGETIFTIHIYTAAQLAFVAQNWDTDGYEIHGNSDIDYYKCNIELYADLDMTAATWKPMGTDRFQGTFNGNGHTIRIKIDDSSISSNDQGLIETIGSDGTVKNLHVDGKIKVGNARIVGAIAGDNYGTIENCWVSADVESSHYSSYDADLGGITGWNESGGTVKFCCMTGNVTNTGGNYGVGGIAGSNDGTIEHCTFYGSVSVDHSQDSKYVGDQDGTAEDLYDTYYDVHYNYASGNDMYCRSIKYYSLPSTYVISSSGDWDSFLDYVNHGCSFSSRSVRLDTDISTSSIVSVSDVHPFRGDFNGNGHTINASINYTGDGHSDGGEAVALFRNINGATIRNLRVTGSINGGQRVAALAGFVDGTANRIEGCVVKAEVHGDTYVSGLVGHAKSSGLTVDGCVFDGTMYMPSSNNYSYSRAFIGYSDNSNICVSNCLWVVHNSLVSPSLSAPGNRSNYYVANFRLDGIKASEASNVGIGTQLSDYSIVRTYEHGVWFGDKYYVDNSYALLGSGTEGNPIRIGSTDDWNKLVNAVNGGYTISGQFVKLTSNISVSTMAGSSDGISFQGTFDGDGKTLTVDYNTTENNTAPFRHVKNATIKNLHVTGTITTSAPFAGGIVSESHGALTLTGCRSSVAIHSSKSGDGTHSGLVSVLSGRGNTILIDGCVFDGSFASTTGTVGCGGFVGWGVYNKPTIKNSLLKPSSVDASMMGSNFARWHTGDEGIYEPTFTNCYYVATDNLPTDQGQQVYALAAAPANLGEVGTDYGFITAYENGILFDGTYYVAPATISLADNATNDVDAINGYFANVTLADRTLYKDGAWNTLCLPFDVTLSGSVLDGAVVKTLSSSDYDNETGTLTLNFTDNLTEIEAGKPYIVKWDGDGTQNIVSPIFGGVTISSTSATTETDGSDWVDFVGTYSPTVIYEDGSEKHNLYLGSSNTLYYPTRTGFEVNACRAYFVLKNGLTAGEPSTPQQAPARAFVLNFGDGEPSAISTLRADTASAADGIYTLDGRRLTGKPTAKGLYIVNGKKIIIK